jgi:hypothetical protein
MSRIWGPGAFFRPGQAAPIRRAFFLRRHRRYMQLSMERRIMPPTAEQTAMTMVLCLSIQDLISLPKLEPLQTPYGCG